MAKKKSEPSPSGPKKSRSDATGPKKKGALPAPKKQAGAAAPKTDLERVQKALQRLHDQGTVDLNAPLRNAIPFMQKTMTNIQKVDEDDFWWIIAGHWGDIPGIFFGFGSD